MGTWEKVLVAILAAGILFWMWPRVSQNMKHAPKGTSSEWMNLLFILGLVVLFVLLLIMAV
ncbi:MAG TPA: hypothetical protein EYN73_05430 [Chromatiaceae bacterium]|jgi:zinc transporter ZupT|nr:hypothetical protein [Chromatiaceae bacterium]HIA08501.1 hypothetical protein [Chromatiaceae bacterium]HIO55381.1 hypothetical protein [Chromatiales bacterium]